MTHRMRPIEIAEGALLADISIVFQLLSLYMPYLDVFFRMLTSVVFAVLVLRRGLYVGVMASAVALFVVGVMTGFQLTVPLIFTCGAGLYLGVTMKRRVPWPVVLLVGTTGSAVAVYAVVVVFALLAGLPLTELLVALQKSYAAAVSVMSFLASQAGLTDWWHGEMYPAVNSVAQVVFTYWWIFYFVALWLLLWPVVIGMYAFTNAMARLLGYDVTPFPGRAGGRLIVRLFAVREGIKRGLIRRGSAT